MEEVRREVQQYNFRNIFTTWWMCHGVMVLYCVAKSGAGAFIPSTTFEPLHCCDRQKQAKL